MRVNPKRAWSIWKIPYQTGLLKRCTFWIDPHQPIKVVKFLMLGTKPSTESSAANYLVKTLRSVFRANNERKQALEQFAAIPLTSAMISLDWTKLNGASRFPMPFACETSYSSHNRIVYLSHTHYSAHHKFFADFRTLGVVLVNN
jgi:hypothetical protein